MKRKLICGCLILVGLLATGLSFFQAGYASSLRNKSLQLSDVRPNAIATYTLAFNAISQTTLGSIQLLFCENGALPEDPCTPPNGLNLLTANLASQTGETGFSIDVADSTATRLVLSRSPATATSSTATYLLTNVHNPSDPGSQFLRISTFASADASGGLTDKGSLVFNINQPIVVSAEVPPYLLFCTGITIPAYSCSSATGNDIDFGELTPRQTRSAESQLLAATNAAYGYSIRLFGSTLTSGNNFVAPLSKGDYSRIGIGQFGLNARANADPPQGQEPSGGGTAAAETIYGTPDVFRFAPGEVLASTDGADDYKKFTISYIANVSKDQPAGIYASTITYMCLANF